MNPKEECILSLIKEKKMTQRQLWLSSRYAEVEPGVWHKPESAALREIRRTIRELRLTHHQPILSGRDGYWIPKSDEEVKAYLERLEKSAKASARSYMVTYHSIRNTFEFHSEFFEQQGKLF